MRKKHSSNFVLGILLGVLAGLLVWYWQKSTSAEDGALDLLDRLAETEARLRNTRSIEEKRPSPATESDDLQRVKGIGPVFSSRLKNAGITLLAQLAVTPDDDLADILQISLKRAGTILAEARRLS